MINRLHIVTLWILFLVTGINAYAQMDSVSKAVDILQSQELSQELRVKQALEIIDKAIVNPEASSNAYAWYVRGYVYKEMYKTFESANKKSKTRLDAVSFLKKSITLDSTKEYLDNTRQTLKYLGSTFYNDASSTLDTMNYPIAIESYENFKLCMLAAEPAYNLKIREIEFQNALATVYEKKFRENVKTNIAFYTKTEELYKKVISIDTNNYNANYDLSMMYYNYGVDIIKNMSVEIDIFYIDNIQEDARVQFKKALPYALKAYALNPTRIEILSELEGIYFSLYEFDLSNKFKLLREQLEKEK